MMKQTIFNTSKRLLISNSLKRCKVAPIGRTVNLRYNSTSKSEKDVKPVYTVLSDENDPERNMFFRYTWGTWLKNDKLEKERRFTRFSIEGLNKILESIKEIQIPEKSGKLLKPLKQEDNTVIFRENIDDLLGGDEKLSVKTMASIHEGKHNKLYKIDLTNGKTLALRIPYKLLTEYGTSRQIQSEVATMDFVRHKLGIKVPKVLAYGMHSLNPTRSPFILMEYVEGDLLMKKWNPAIDDTVPNHKDVLNSVIDPLSEFQHKLLSVKFNSYGSLYFHDDVSPKLQMKGEPYENEQDENLKNRYRIGLLTERNLWRNKEILKPDQFNPYLGPVSNPSEVISDAASMEAEALKTRLALSDADASSKVEDPETLKSAISVYEKLAVMSSHLLNSKSTAIPNVDSLVEPKLYNSDIDPMNVIEGKNGDLTFIDFENVVIKPFIYTNSPNFINYDGYKIYDLKSIEGFDKLLEMEKYQYELMYKRTRNQFLWEMALNTKDKKLIASVSPYIKELRSPYTRLLLSKTDSDYLFVEEALLKIKHNWKAYLDSDLVSGEEQYPVKWTDAELQEFEKNFTEYQKSLMEQPFAATGGWIPQDMFERLLGEGKIEKTGDEYVLKKFDLQK